LATYISGVYLPVGGKNEMPGIWSKPPADFKPMAELAFLSAHFEPFGSALQHVRQSRAKHLWKKKVRWKSTLLDMIWHWDGPKPEKNHLDKQNLLPKFLLGRKRHQFPATFSRAGLPRAA
jgi:hypothetical protein